MRHHPIHQKVYNFLHYGYLPPKKIPGFLRNLEMHEPIKPTVANTVELFEEVFSGAIEKSVGNGYCIIPVSGGWDSRALLGYALESMPAKQIKTYTFGTKGQLDFDIGKKLAKKAGVEHVAFDLNDIPITWKALKKFVQCSPWTYTFDSFFNKYCYEQMSGNADFILSGFMGDPLTGGHMYQKNNENIRQSFANSQFVTNTKIPLENEYKPSGSLPDIPKGTPFSDHQLFDLGVRQSHCIAPIVSYSKSWNSWDTILGNIPNSNTKIIAPFVHPKWIYYWLNVPDSRKENSNLYMYFLEKKFPELANLPSKEFYGARKRDGISAYLRKKKYHGKLLLSQRYPIFFNEPKEMLNYLDFDLAFRNREDYKEILVKSMVFLKKHSLVDWLDLDALKEEHMTYGQDHSKLFLVLIGLALNIEIEKHI